MRMTGVHQFTAHGSRRSCGAVLAEPRHTLGWRCTSSGRGLLPDDEDLRPRDQLLILWDWTGCRATAACSSKSASESTM